MILDATAGVKGIYRGLDLNFREDELVFIDKRMGVYQPKYGHEKCLIVQPTAQTDLKSLPFRDKLFNMVIYDPPWLSASLDNWVGARYGSADKHSYTTLNYYANLEFHRVLINGGILFIKIQDVQHRKTSLDHHFSNFKRLLHFSFPTKSGGRLLTYWLVFIAK